MTFTLKRDDFTPFMRRAQQLAASPRPVVRALCLKFESIAKRNFNADKSFRPAPWPPLASGDPSNLYKSGTLFQYIHSDIGDRSGVVGSPCPYAAQHQTGGSWTQPARKGVVRLRTTASGELVRQKGYGHLAVFAKVHTSAKHKSFREVAFTAAAHKVTMPARPYFPVEADLQTLTEKARLAMMEVGQLAVRKMLEKAA